MLYVVSSSRWPQYHWQILHVGPDGCIRGSLEPYKFMKGPCINDGLWHHIALSASPDWQCMFVDGHVACSINVGIGRGLHRCVLVLTMFIIIMTKLRVTDRRNNLVIKAIIVTNTRKF